MLMYSPVTLPATDSTIRWIKEGLGSGRSWEVLVLENSAIWRPLARASDCAAATVEQVMSRSRSRL
jgi:hypothetical protein